MSTMTCNDVGCDGDPEYTVTLDSAFPGLEGLGPDVDEIKLCQACYLEALRMTREKAAISLTQGSPTARALVEALDAEMARVKNPSREP